jgi:hypothetical protein
LAQQARVVGLLVAEDGLGELALADVARDVGALCLVSSEFCVWCVFLRERERERAIGRVSARNDKQQNAKPEKEQQPAPQKTKTPLTISTEQSIPRYLLTI